MYLHDVIQLRVTFLPLSIFFSGFVLVSVWIMLLLLSRIQLKLVLVAFVIKLMDAGSVVTVNSKKFLQTLILSRKLKKKAAI